MVTRRSFIVSVLVLLQLVSIVSCAPEPNLDRGKYLQLVSYTDPGNEVNISVDLTRALDNHLFLEATFSPPHGYHLYSKDLPRDGDNGQGRPTLLELPSGSKMQALGVLSESVSSYMVGYEPDGPLIYPDGPVTLSLPVKLPSTRGWVNDQISLTYTACTEVECKIPTIGKLINVRVPGALSIEP